MLDKIRNNFGFYGTVSILFGVLFAFSFYKAGLGISYPFFIAAICVLLYVCMKKLGLPIKKFTWFAFTLCVLLAISLVFTTNTGMQLLTTAGILILLDFSLIHQLNDDADFLFFEFVSRILKLPFGALAAIGFPFVDGFRFISRTRLFKNGTFRNVLFGLIAAVPILGILLLLLSNADMMFDRLAGRFVKNLFFTSDPFFCLLMILAGFLVCYAVLCAACGMSSPGFIGKTLFPEEKVELPESELNQIESAAVADTTFEDSKTADSALSSSAPKKINSVFLSTILTSITLVYTVFCGIQILYLFAGGIFTLPEQFTYSEYARKGFFELLFVAVLNFVLVIFCISKAEKTKAVKILLTAMSGCTFIMIASAAYRMLLYVSSYHMTMLRLLVLFFLGVLTVLMAGAVAAVYAGRFSLFLYTAAVMGISLLILNAARPDTLIASYNLSAQETYTMSDIYYLTGSLSIDAAPQIFEFCAGNPVIADDAGNLVYELKNYADFIKSDYERRGIRALNFSCRSAYYAALEYFGE